MPPSETPVVIDPAVRLRRRYTWPALALACLALCEVLRHGAGGLDVLPLPLAVATAAAAAIGGIAPGLAGALLCLAYLTWAYLGEPASPASHAELLRRETVAVILFPALAVLVGELRRRVDRAVDAAAQTRSDAQFRTMIDAASEVIVLADAQGRLVYANDRALETFGYRRETLYGLKLWDLIAPESLAAQPLRMDELDLRGELHVERVLLHHDGHGIPAGIAIRRLADGRYFAIVRDLTRQREDIGRLERALALVRATLESTTDAILVVDQQGRWAGLNRRFVEMWRIPEEIVAAGDDERGLEHAVGLLESPEQFRDRAQKLRANPEAESFDEFRLKDGRVIERYSQPQRTAGGIVGRVWSFRDVTQARNNLDALRESERRFQQAQKLEAIGRLAGGVAHDFNNMLTAILGEAELLLASLPPEAPSRGQLENIRDAALRSANLTRQLLAFGRRQVGDPRVVPLGVLVHGLQALILRLAGPRVQVRFELPSREDGPWVLVDPSQLEQALFNLVINAQDAMPDGGALRVSVGRAAPRAPADARGGAAPARPHARIEVADTGIGMSEEVRRHLFEPFFTTKPVGEGTGLGLASVYGFVDQSGGTIEVESEAGQGATFRILLPEAAPPPQASEPLAARSWPAPPTARGETVLVAEDEAPVRTFVAEVLRQLGYRVIESEDGEEAIGAARTHAGEIELLLTDVVMPGMSGVELARRLRENRPGLSVLMMSGYPGPALDGVFPADDRPALLAKPFDTLELATRVRTVLDAARAAT